MTLRTIAFLAMTFATCGLALGQTTQQVPDIDVNPAAWMRIIQFGIMAGIVSFLQDLHSWAKSNEPYEWKLAGKRVLAAVTGGILGAMGLTAVGM